MKLHESWQLKAEQEATLQNYDFESPYGNVYNDFIEGYSQGAQNCLDAVEATITNMLQDLYTPEEKQAIKDVLTKLQTLKPL